MSTPQHITGPDGAIYVILSRDGHGIGLQRGYSIWLRNSGGALIYRGFANTRAEAKRRITSGMFQ